MCGKFGSRELVGMGNSIVMIPCQDNLVQQIVLYRYTSIQIGVIP